ncbi:CR1 protein, partial [Zapornia atra]|nr:CR1 protein [Zapornia atra]
GDCWQPPRFVFAEPPTPLQESYAVGTTLTYKCRPGYTVAQGKSPRVTCLPSSHWSSDPDFCIGKSCSSPDIPNGRFHYKTDLLFGTTVNFTCDTGYRLFGNPSAQCVLKSNNEVGWDNVPYCDPIPCPPPPETENGYVTNGYSSYTFGMAITYKCNNGFSLIGNAEIVCTEENLQGKWSGSPPECKVVRCENPEVKNGRRVSGYGTEHTYGNTVSFECNPGYLMNGSSVVTCEADNKWKPPLPTCYISCGPAPHFPFAELTQAVGDSLPVGTELRYRCKQGYTPAHGTSSVVTCLSDGTWSADPDFCIRELPAIFCDEPPTISNGMHNGTKGTSFVPGSVIVYKCKEGFTLTGTASIHCEVDPDNQGVWSKPSPECRGELPAIFCDEPPTISNGMHNGTKGTSFVPGSVIVYKCKEGFTLTGTASIHCKTDPNHHGVWSKPTPECRGGADRIIVGLIPLLLALLVMSI